MAPLSGERHFLLCECVSDRNLQESFLWISGHSAWSSAFQTTGPSNGFVRVISDSRPIVQNEQENLHYSKSYLSFGDMQKAILPRFTYGYLYKHTRTVRSSEGSGLGSVV